MTPALERCTGRGQSCVPKPCGGAVTAVACRQRDSRHPCHGARKVVPAKLTPGIRSLSDGPLTYGTLWDRKPTLQDVR
jgi:hypothetical protein